MLIHIGVIREERPNSNRYQVGGDMFRRWFGENYPTPVEPPTPPLAPPPSPPPTSREVQLLRVFVASPSDVAEERKAIDPIVAEINQTIARRLKIMLDVVMWETDTYPGIAPGGPQAVIEKQIDLDNTDLVIGIFWRRFGTDTGFGNSGSSHEIKRACELSALRKKPHVMVYFCEKPSIVRTLDEAEQQRKLFEFKEQLQRMGMLIWQFESAPAVR